MREKTKYTIPLRLSEELRILIYKLAQQRQMSIADTCRQLILESAKANGLKLEVKNVS